MEIINLQIQEAQQTPAKMNTKNLLLVHQGQVAERQREGGNLESKQRRMTRYKQEQNKEMEDLSSETIKARNIGMTYSKGQNNTTL